LTIEAKVSLKKLERILPEINQHIKEILGLLGYAWYRQAVPSPRKKKSPGK
jgi:hypothetical protein